MSDGLIETAAKVTGATDPRIYGVATGEVITNCDQTNQGRVQVRLPWLPGYEPWARVAAPMAGMESGAYFMPQKGDEVLVAFNQGDVLEAFVVGSMWNGANKTPVGKSSDASSKWVLRTPGRHEIVFDDDAQSIAITHASGPHVTLGAKTIEVKLDDKDTAAMTLDSQGNITIKAKQRITLDAPNVEIKGTDRAALQSGSAGSVEIKGGALCTIDATHIDIG